MKWYWKFLIWVAVAVIVLLAIRFTSVTYLLVGFGTLIMGIIGGFFLCAFVGEKFGSIQFWKEDKDGTN